ncbi:hypothetical protein X802_02640 [Thermococcus guaymasensis DSM 11113]|uniref:Uncharacterized protein n=1 Tax=Thermococcus guaymasensis DSM 11113 TaxID=1432656 RepID=A0A0X1KIW0_9EURY|nr:hypothetical protein [Thermococcus guaymasensis]AJC71193.1 hypothetical protein X802_02640 [Thermococcus guaymasensis DSM 11113]
MPVIGINLTKIEFEKKGVPPIGGRIEVNLTPKVRDMRLGEIRSPTGRMNGVEILFKYEITYRPEIAEGLIEGAVMYLPQRKEDVDRILDTWDAERKVPPEVFAEVINFLTAEISPLLFVIAKEMRLPYHIPLPRVEVKPKG